MADNKKESKGMGVVGKTYFPDTGTESPKQTEDQAVQNKDDVQMSRRDFNCMMGVINNTTQLFRSDALSKLLNPGLDINFECHYPDSITTSDYVKMFDREGLAERVVNIFPEESWAMNPEVKEDNTSDESEFDKKWKEIEKQQKIYHYLQRVDVLSGIGRYGVLLLGLNDGLELKEPVASINELTGEKVGSTELELIFLKPFQEVNVDIDKKEEDSKSPRFDQPVLYNLKFENTDGSGSQSRKVHWTRVIHIADNRLTSEVFGKPRMKSIYNRLLDIRKVLSGSGEMFWKGAYQGLGFETQKDFADATIDSDALKETMRDYSSGLQRFIHAQGLNIKNLAPNIADPASHIKVQIEYIALSLGVPVRLLIGSERGELASSQDQKSWNKRISKRREDYLSPLVLRLLIDRLIIFGVLPEVKEYVIVWPDLDAPSEKEKMEIAKIAAEAMGKYVQSEVFLLMSDIDFFVRYLGMSKDEAEEVSTNAANFAKGDGNLKKDDDSNEDDNNES
jgi:hypothetical protein